jgi:hypothetical protein
VPTGAYGDLTAVDGTLAGMMADLPGVSYVSLVGALCRDGACLARVPGENELDLMAVDAGHLTPKGSSYVGRLLMKPLLESADPR